ncbi:DUF805 domain-containing protein [Ornithobacterium rhinotracheale]|uniref:DUF805 domain-containing protein n=1 Tax=Ornithobacterium rhinotracheale TaxID=28251 RepID=UPI003FA4CC6B
MKENFNKYFVNVLKNDYANFKGRTNRKAYWIFVGINLVISIILGIIDGITGLPILGLLFSLATLVPSIAIGVRRMHDVGKSGWFLLIPFYNLYLAIQPSDAANQYGAPEIE